FVTRAQGHFDDAEHLGQRAIACQEAAWDRAHHRVAKAHEDIAETYRRLARYHLAQNHLERTLEVHEARGTLSDHARSLRTIGDLYLHMEQWGKAESCHRRALDELKRCHAPALDLSIVASSLALACAHLDKIDEAEELAQS